MILQTRCAAFANLHFRNVYKGFWDAIPEPFTAPRFDKDYKGDYRILQTRCSAFKTINVRIVYNGFWDASSEPCTTLRFDIGYKGISQGFANQVFRFQEP